MTLRICSNIIFVKIDGNIYIELSDEFYSTLQLVTNLYSFQSYKLSLSYKGSTSCQLINITKNGDGGQSSSSD